MEIHDRSHDSAGLWYRYSQEFNISANHMKDGWEETYARNLYDTKFGWKPYTKEELDCANDWVRVECKGGVLRTRWWIFEFHNGRIFLDQLYNNHLIEEHPAPLSQRVSQVRLG